MLSKIDLKKALNSNKVVIYPTDTIYGIGCNATNSKSVKKVRLIKKRDSKPFSIIAPSKEWILKNCEVKKEWLKVLPGPYTLILNLKNNSCISKSVNDSKKTLGVRIPDHWIKDIVKSLNFPIVSTSANTSGKKPMTSLKDLEPNILSKVDFIFFEGEKSGSPSTIIDYTSGEKKVIKR